MPNPTTVLDEYTASETSSRVQLGREPGFRARRAERLPPTGRRIPEAHVANGRFPVRQDRISIARRDEATVGTERDGVNRSIVANQLEKRMPKQDDVHETAVDFRARRDAMRRNNLQQRALVAATMRTRQHQRRFSGKAQRCRTRRLTVASVRTRALCRPDAQAGVDYPEYHSVRGGLQQSEPPLQP